MGQLSAPMKAALEARAGVNAWVTKVDLPDGDTWRWTQSPFTSREEGNFDVRVKTYSPIRFTPSDAGGSLPTVETTIDVRDDDRRIARFYEGQYGRKLRGAPVAIRHANTVVEPDGWRPLMTGIIANITWPSRLVARLTLRADDTALRRLVPKPGWRITIADWPNAVSSAQGMYAPILYGSHNSGGYSEKGFVPLICVDRLTFTYLLCAQWAKGINAVFSAGVMASSATYEIQHQLRRGRRYTTVRFDSDQGDAAITADCRGYDAGGNGSGSMIAGPVGQLAHYLTNFVYGDTADSASGWPETSPRISTDGLEELDAYLTARGHIGARRIASPGTAAEEINRWLETTGTRVWWNGAGQLVFKADPIDRTNIYDGPRVMQPAGFSLDEEDSQAISGSVTVNYVMDDVSGQFQQTLNVRMPNIEDETADEISQTWGVAE